MRKIILTTFIIFSIAVKSQIKALTEDGKEVILLDNKTWKYVNESDEKVLEIISTNDQNFEKPKDATFLARSKKINAGLYYNPKKWKIIPGNYPIYMDYAFSNISVPDIYSLFGSEKAPVQTLKNLKNLVTANVQRNADYFRLKESEYRTVNNIKVLHLKYSANMKGIDFEYIANYYLTDEGYCSVLVYTFANQYEANKNEMENLTDGLVKTEKQQKGVSVELPPPPLSKPSTK